MRGPEGGREGGGREKCVFEAVFSLSGNSGQRQCDLC